MRLLADTHAIYWFLGGDRRLSLRARDAMADPDNEVFASAVSGYELGLKAARGRLNVSVVSELAKHFRVARFGVLPITLEHALAAGELPGPHRDPWDRVIMAQATIENLTVVTKDTEFTNYGIPVLW